MLYQEQVCPDITLWCVQRLSIVKLDSHSNSGNITLAHLSTSSLISFVLFFFFIQKRNYFQHQEQWIWLKPLQTITWNRWTRTLLMTAVVGVLPKLFGTGRHTVSNSLQEAFKSWWLPSFSGLNIQVLIVFSYNARIGRFGALTVF